MSKQRVFIACGVMLLTACGVPRARSADGNLGDLVERIPAVGMSEEEQPIRDAITEGAAYLLGLAREQTDTFLFAAPTRNYTKTDVKQVEVRYRRVTRTVPEYQYKTFKAMQRNRYGMMVEVTRKRPIKQVGTRQESYLVRDDKGDVVRMQDRAGGWDRSKPIGPAYYHAGILGQNGICLYALLSAGVPPDTDPLPQTIETLWKHVLESGPPDRTWDLAWLVAGLSNVPEGDEELETLKKRLANKLLLGQVDSGAGKGLWGPVCVNPNIVAALMAYEQKYFDKPFARLSTDLKRKPGDRSAQRKYATLKKERDAFVDQLLYYTQTFTAERPHDVNVRLGDAAADDDQRIRVTGVPLFTFGESLADLESTRLALFALAEARRNGCLPTKTISPKDEKGRDLTPSLDTRAVIAQTVGAVTRLAQRDGSWMEGNVCAAVKAFDKLGFVGLPVRISDLPKLESESTVLSALDGYAALCSAAYLGGMKEASLPISATSQRLTQLVPKALEKPFKRNTKEALLPYRAALSLTGVPGPSRAVTGALVDHLLNATRDTVGMWGIDFGVYAEHSSLARYNDVTRKRAFENLQSRDPARWPEASDAMIEKARRHRLTYYGLRLRNHVYRTAGTLAYLAGATQRPVVGIWPWGGARREDPIIPSVLDTLRETTPTTATIRSVVLEKDLANLSLDVPSIYVSGSGAFSPDAETMQRVAEYLSGGGMLLGLGMATSAGVTFLDGIEGAVLNGVPGSKVEAFSLYDGRAELRAVVREDGTVAMLAFPIAARSPAAGLSRRPLPGKLALRLMSEALKTRFGPALSGDQPLVDLTRLAEFQRAALEAPAGE